MVDSDFVKGNSNNLPKVDMFMVCEYVKNSDDFNAAEFRNAKVNISSRQNYGDSAIGYVCLKRENTICTVKAKVCPEHRVRNKAYSVTLTVNEETESIINVECHDCAASSGGCKHAIAFLMWTHRRSEEPSPTDVQCYWKKPVLAKVGTAKQFIEAKDLLKTSTSVEPGNISSDEHPSFLQTILHIAKTKNLDSQLSRHHYVTSERHITLISLHFLMIDFVKERKSLADEFMLFAQSRMSEAICEEVNRRTIDQSDNSLWYELRYGRITASKLYECAHCQTPDGTLVNGIIGASKLFYSAQMERGKRLENEVLHVLQNKTGLECYKCGLLLSPMFPVLGASPDAIGDNFIVEIKCPSSDKTFKKFLPSEDTISQKCKAQMQLQMFMAKRKKGLFCVAHPDFESSKNITCLWMDFDEKYTASIIEEVILFWKNHIFPKLLHFIIK
ncbi:PREDICTED: uncharacterized protein LOC105458122 [Wasmannia auropunctata]|uniref:uncharacterized protein LOC105458122 n=1 Tax=Wasmannia auropunctata TaxID=64793 RepID=UPI0005ED9644|nr:PREDICTED: uncharacterized protein LOC105458122 [Wasmannia auropunctata]